MHSMSSLFQSLRAPLVNTRWSLGASTKDYVLLRVWQDQTKTVDGVMTTEVYTKQKDLNDKLGQRERERHLQEVKAGKSCYLIMCVAKNPNENTRAIKSFGQESIFVGGGLEKTEDGSLFIKVVDRMKITDFRKKYDIR